MDVGYARLSLLEKDYLVLGVFAGVVSMLMTNIQGKGGGHDDSDDVGRTTELE